ncbi:MAG: RIP metalloprotease RseP [Zoogloeaceae bacterium]|nr:RIP metalloprotease RseP [Zoogloeaceae bacterium]
MLNTLFFIAAFLLLLGALIVFHELGHFSVARWCGVKVLRFSLGFGPVLWRRRFGRDQTEWTLCALPLGGFVSMLGEQSGEDEQPLSEAERARAFKYQSLGKRAAIVSAGPMANLLLAALIYWGLFFVGTEQLLPVLGAPPAGTPAALAGVHNGDRALSVGGEETPSWADFRWQFVRKAADAEAVSFVIERDGAQRTLSVDTAALGEDGWSSDPFAKLGLRFYQLPVPPVIGKVQADSPAQAAGMLPGDKVLFIAGQPVRWWGDLAEALSTSTADEIVLQVERDGQPLTLAVRPKTVEANGFKIRRIGVEAAEPHLARDLLPRLNGEVSYGFFESGFRAVRETWEKSVFNLKMFGRMLTGHVSWKNLSGPITIADYAGKTAKMGWADYLAFMALVSIGLGILNLLPVPVLDGGHLLYYAAEFVRGRPLPEGVLLRGQQVGMFLLMTLMAFALFNDLNRLF